MLENLFRLEWMMYEEVIGSKGVRTAGSFAENECAWAVPDMPLQHLPPHSLTFSHSALFLPNALTFSHNAITFRCRLETLPASSQALRFGPMLANKYTRTNSQQTRTSYQHMYALLTCSLCCCSKYLWFLSNSLCLQHMI